MGATDFPAWYSAGVFGGIGCALLSAIAIATWALWRRRGVTGQVIGALLVCAVASALDIGPLLWSEYRLNVYGPTLSMNEVGAALAAAALVGWMAPLGAICWYSLLARPVASNAAGSTRKGSPAPAALDDPARSLAAYSTGKPWGFLAPVAPAPGDSAGRPIELLHALTIIGREQNNDIVLDDERVSRRHAELRWERGRVELADYGSMNGTLVNQQSVRGRLLLRDGDTIEFGAKRFRLSLQPAEQPSDAPEATATVGEPLETRKTASVSGAFAKGAPVMRLTLLQGASLAGQGTSWPLAAPVTTIGRDPTCGIPLADTAISRTHAQITRQPAGHFIADLQSSNGVYLNGSRLTAPTQLFAGDIVALGDCLLRCEEIAASSQSAPGAGGADGAASDRAEPASEADAQISSAPAGAPSFHMRIAPEWSPHRNNSRPRLAPPRLSPTTLQGESSPSEQS